MADASLSESIPVPARRDRQLQDGFRKSEKMAALCFAPTATIPVSVDDPTSIRDKHASTGNDDVYIE